MFTKPSFKDLFGPEIRQNIINRFGDRVSQQTVIDEGYYYSLDMCFEFQKKSGGLLSEDWIRHISSEVYDGMQEYCFDLYTDKESFVTRVVSALNNPYQAKSALNRYYNR